ncbi:MAG TPA: hypothetical protein VNA20_00355 [Frankiaceae bacterium]|nr:hypothetical protein [Frankiaceae bacterium]
MTFRRRRVALVVAAALVGAAGPAATADPEHTGREGAPCAFVELTGVKSRALGPGGTLGYLAGGPFAGDGTLTCSVQYGAAAHSAPDAAAASASGTDVVYLTPTRVSVSSTTGEKYFCTKWTPADGSPALYLTALDWTADPSAPCSSSVGATGSELGRVTLLPTPPPPPVPVYPRGTITLSQQIGGFTIQRTGFAPTGVWGCSDSGFRYTCEPPPPEPGTYYVCGGVAVTVNNNSAGTVIGRSGCGSGVSAQATAGPFNKAIATARPRSGFPVWCEAEPDVLAFSFWSVECAFGA